MESHSLGSSEGVARNGWMATSLFRILCNTTRIKSEGTWLVLQYMHAVCLQSRSPLTVKARWVHPLNFREEDRPVLDLLEVIAKKEESDLTNVIRKALREFTQRECAKPPSSSMDDFIRDPGFKALPPFSHILRPEELKSWTNEEILHLSKTRPLAKGGTGG